jgi:hypothetical protein
MSFNCCKITHRKPHASLALPASSFRILPSPFSLLATAFAVLLLFSATFAAAAGGPATLRLNFSKGDVYHYTLEMNGIVEMAVKAPEIQAAESASMPPMDLALYAEIEMDVKNVDQDQKASLEVFLNRVRVNTGQGKVSDSDKDEDLPKFLTALMDDPLKIKLAPNGKILDMKYPKIENMDQGFADLVPPGFNPVDIARQSMFVLPEKPVNVGDKWTQTVEFDFPFSPGKKLKMTYNFEMMGYEKVKEIDCAVVRITVKDDLSKQVGEFKMPFTGEGETATMRMNRLMLDFQGKFFFAPLQGIFMGLEGTMDQELSGNISGPGPAGKDETVGLNINFSADVTLQLR